MPDPIAPAPTEVTPAGDATTPIPVDPGETALAAAIAAENSTHGQSVEDLPDWAQKIIHDTRQEAKNNRTAAQTAAQKAQQEMTDKLAVALGLKPDAATDPAALTASLAEAQSKAAQSARELAIFKAATVAGADPSRLLDSNSFMTSVSQVDPGDGAAVTAAITAAVAANPNLKAVQTAAASGTELGGSGEQGQITEEQLKFMKPEEINKALREGKLAHLL